MAMLSSMLIIIPTSPTICLARNLPQYTFAPPRKLVLRYITISVAVLYLRREMWGKPTTKMRKKIIR